jgi:hypothetical protein
LSQAASVRLSVTSRLIPMTWTRVSEGLDDLSVPRDVGEARRAPGRPEIEHDDPAAQVGRGPAPVIHVAHVEGREGLRELTRPPVARMSLRSTISVRTATSLRRRLVRVAVTTRGRCPLADMAFGACPVLQ